MPIPTADNTAVRAAERLRQIGKMCRSDAVKYIAQCDASAVFAHDLVNAFAVNLLVPAIAEWATLKAVTGVQAALRQMFSGQWASDAAVTTDLNTAQTAMEQTRDYIVANTPVDGNGWVLTLKVVSNAFEQRIVTGAPQITPLRAQLVTLRDAFA